MSPRDTEKRLAAEAALALVQHGMTLGLGTGTTAEFFLRALATSGRRVRGVPSSEATRRLAASLGIPLVGFDTVQRLDLAIDGADEIDPELRLIKGGGGALLYEKIVATAADRFVVIADTTKRVARLGGVPLPVEVVPFAAPLLLQRFQALGTPTLRRTANGPFVTDAGHHIIDLQLDLADPESLDAKLHAMPGVVETGLFLGLAERVLYGDGTVALRR